MSNSKKRKYDEQLNIPTDFRCIIHNSGLSNHGDCVTLNSTKLKVSAEQKLDQLHSIRNKRLAEPCDSPHRMHDICKSIPASLCGIDLNITGYHRGCYQAFTKNLDRLSKAECTKHSQKHHSPRIFANCSNQFPPECIFCKKLEVKPKKHANTERCVQFTNTTWQQIESQAFEVGDFALYRLVQGEDLVAREAMFHTSCRKDFELKVFNLSKRQSMGGSVKNSHTSENLAQQSVRDMISQKVVVQKEVIPLASVRDLYITEMHNNGFPNINYNNRTLKVWLQSDPIGQKIAFTKQKGAGCIMHSVVFSADMTVPEAIASGFKLGSSSVKEEVATYLRKSVKQACTVSKPLPWPPTADDLDAFPPEELVPDALQTFLTQLVCGDSAGTEKTRRIVLSIAQVFFSSIPIKDSVNKYELN